MLTFYNEKGEAFGAQVEFTVKNAVNGERSVSGTIISNDRVLSEIDRGWKFEFDGEFYNIVYAKPRDEGRNLSVSFDAVHQFFYDFGHSNCYTEFNGSHRFEVYIEAIFKDSGYRYQIGPRVRVNSIRKENFGNAKRLEMFKDIIKAAGLEFSVSGKVVLITKKIGADLSTVVRKNFNMNELVIEKNINKFITYKRGLGAWKDEEDHSKGRYTSEYESPLASIYGRIEGEPVTDERYKDTDKLLRRLKFEVDNSYSISVQLDMEDLTRAGYQYTQPRAGDYIMAINETIGFWEKIRIVSFESSYDVTGRLINHKVTCNDIGSVQKQISSEGSIIRSVGQSKEYAESALAVATKALASADGKNTVYYGATKPKDEPIGIIRRGDILYLTAGEDTEMYTWNGAEWELRKLKFDTAELEKKFDKVKKATEQASEENKRRTDEAFKKAGASEDLAKEVKQIALDSTAKLEEFKRESTSAQTALSGDLDVLKRTVTNEVNQASEHRRTTTEALSRMTGQMDGFATKSEVKQGIDGLTQTFAKMKVGGRNYAEDYDFSRGLWIYSQGDSSPVDWKIINGEYNVKGTTNTWKQMQIHSREGSQSSRKSSTALLDLEVGETYTLSFQGICYSGSPNIWVSLRANRTVPGNPEIMYGNFNLTSSWQTYQVTVPALTKPDNFDFWRIILGYNEIGHVAFRKVELTRSSTRIDAGPAPEDGKTDLVVAKSEFQKTADGLSAKLATVENYVGQDSQRQEALRRYTREESAKQATSVRELVNRDFVGKASYQEDVRAIERKFEAITNPQNGSIATQIATYKNAVDGRFTEITSLISGKASQADFQRVRETSQLYERIIGSNENDISNKVARMALTNQLFQVEVTKASASGRNLFLNSLFKRDLRERYSTYDLFDGKDQTQGQLALSIDTNEKFKGANTLKIVSTFNGKLSNQKATFTIGGDARLGTIDEMRNKSVRFSFWAKSTVNNTNFQARAGYRNTIQGVSLTTDWKFYDIEFIRKENSNATSELILHIFTAATVWIAFPKIEIGTVATPFSEAPEDTDEAIRSVQSQLAGSWAVQNLTSAGALVSGLNLGANGHNRLDGKLTHITGETLIDKAVIKDGMIASLSASKITAGTIDASTINVINIDASSILAGTLTGMEIRGGQIDSINGNMHINLQTNQFIFNGRASIEFKSPENSIEFNSGGRKAFLAPTVSEGTNYAAFAFGVNDRGNHEPNRDFVGLKIFNQPDSKQVVIVGDLILTSYENQRIKTISLKDLFKLIDENFKRLREFRVQHGEGSPGFWDVTLY